MDIDFQIKISDIVDQINKEWAEMSEEERILIGEEFFLDRYRELLDEMYGESFDEIMPENPDLTGW